MEEILIRIEGLVSLVVDVEHQRATMRTLNFVTAKQIAEAIDKNTDTMEARLVTRNKFNQEFLVKLVRIIVISYVCELQFTFSFLLSLIQFLFIKL